MAPGDVVFFTPLGDVAAAYRSDQYADRGGGLAATRFDSTVTFG